MALASCSGFFFLFCLVFLIKSADSRCEKRFNCGHLDDPLEFPFSNNNECGLFMVDCSASPPSFQLGPGGPRFLIHNQTSANKFVVGDPQLGSDERCHSIQNRSLPHFPYISFAITSPNITILSCNKSLDHSDEGRIRDYFVHGYKNNSECEHSYFYYGFPSHAISTPEYCSIVRMPVSRSDLEIPYGLFKLLSTFELEWRVSANCTKCHDEGRKCLAGSNNEFLCEGISPAPPPAYSSSQGSRKNSKTIKLVAAITVSAAVFLGLCFVFSFLIYRRKKRANGDYQESYNTIQLFLKNNENLAPRKYKYSDLKKMTKSFHEKLGKGGYGSVYKGKLPDGRLVAVKILSEARGNGEEFMNEVASISRTSHINIVTLLGYCFEGSKRALIYEFMPNGSLEKFIQNNATSAMGKGGLRWQKLLDIVVGTARGLEYLHQGCNMRILHFDIKPHNILLDKDMNPKISDFGLAKLCPNRSSIVSMLVARGTIGYIAPEVFCRNFGEVSHKSDVYSYGMMILEVVVGRQNFEHGSNQSSELYFPNCIYKYLEVNGIVELDTVMIEDERQIVRKMIIVGLWCIQTEPKNRPSISRAIEMLTGSTDSLEIPPKPYLSSPPRTAPDASSTFESSTT